jgi:SAM-dependent methyltransferase
LVTIASSVGRVIDRPSEGTGDEHAPDSTPAATRWKRALAAWGIPQPILDAAPADPWAHAVSTFAVRTEQAVADPGGRSYESAVGALLQPGSVLDVGAGVGAASLPLAPHVTSITAVDTSQDMLDAFGRYAAERGVAYECVRGSWPTVAPQVSVHDVVLAYHVVYNVPAIGSFLVALTDHAARRVVVELPPSHPLSWMTPLWERFHGISRPVSPTSDDLVEVLREIGVADLVVESWQQPTRQEGNDDERVAQVTQRLCLGPERQAEVADALRDLDEDHHRQVVTVSWTGAALA